jgi:hypothetical protein
MARGKFVRQGYMTKNGKVYLVRNRKIVRCIRKVNATAALEQVSIANTVGALLLLNTHKVRAKSRPRDDRV